MSWPPGSPAASPGRDRPPLTSPATSRMRLLNRLLAPASAGRLLDGGVEPIEEAGRGDHEDDGCEPLLVVMAGGLVPDLVRHRICAVAEPGGGLGQRQRGPLGVGKVRRLPPGRYRPEPLVGLTRLLCGACARVHACAAAVDLARPQVDQLKRLRRHAARARGLVQAMEAPFRSRVQLLSSLRTWLGPAARSRVGSRGPVSRPMRSQ